MKETLNNLLQRTAADLNNACIAFAMLKGYLEGQTAGEQQNNATMQKSAIRLTKKEIDKLPKNLQDKITIKLTFPVRQKPNGVYEVRYRAHGYNVAVSSLDFDKLKPKFIEALKNDKPRELLTPAGNTSKSFNAVAAQWLELKRPAIKQNTYKFYVQFLGANVYPIFEGRTVGDLKQSDVQILINSYVEQGKFRTATKIYQALKSIFDFAVGEELIERSPMRQLKPPKYEEQNGVALTLEEERELLELIENSNCVDEVRNALRFLLYTGIRRSELASTRIENGCISVICSKTRKGFQEKRRIIPITPMLARWLPQMELDKLHNVRPDALTQAMKRLMPKHHLHELRHTFITRAQECGVSREVVSVWAGHAADSTQTSKVYTHFSREFMLREAQKVIYNL